MILTAAIGIGGSIDASKVWGNAGAAMGASGAIAVGAVVACCSLFSMLIGWASS